MSGRITIPAVMTMIYWKWLLAELLLLLGVSSFGDEYEYEAVSMVRKKIHTIIFFMHS